jgi:ribosome modulation factor
MAPPENAIVICVDEKPSIHALERAQGYLKMQNGRALGGHSHDYNPTQPHLDTVRRLRGGHRQGAGNSQEAAPHRVSNFMNDITAARPDTANHVVLDNLNTHKPKSDRWLKSHPNLTYHFTSTRASWLNQWRSGSRSCKESPCATYSRINGSGYWTMKMILALRGQRMCGLAQIWLQGGDCLRKFIL